MSDALTLSNLLLFGILGTAYYNLKELIKLSRNFDQLKADIPSKSDIDRIDKRLIQIQANTSKDAEMTELERELVKDKDWHKEFRKQ